MKNVVVSEIGCDIQTGNAVVLLNEPGMPKVLPIWVGVAEAKAITLALQKVKTDRPLTHELLFNTIQAMEYAVEKVEIHDVQNNAYIARILLRSTNQNSGKPEYQTIDARPSDAIALAILAGASIFVAPIILERGSVLPVRAVEEPPEDQEFKQFVQGLNASDFKLPDPPKDK